MTQEDAVIPSTSDVLCEAREALAAATDFGIRYKFVVTTDDVTDEFGYADNESDAPAGYRVDTLIFPNIHFRDSSLPSCTKTAEAMYEAYKAHEERVKVRRQLVGELLCPPKSSNLEELARVLIEASRTVKIVTNARPDEAAYYGVKTFTQASEKLIVRQPMLVEQRAGYHDWTPPLVDTCVSFYHCNSCMSQPNSKKVRWVTARTRTLELIDIVPDYNMFAVMYSNTIEDIINVADLALKAMSEFYNTARQSSAVPDCRATALNNLMEDLACGKTQPIMLGTFSISQTNTSLGFIPAIVSSFLYGNFFAGKMSAYNADMSLQGFLGKKVGMTQISDCCRDSSVSDDDNLFGQSPLTGLLRTIVGMSDSNSTIRLTRNFVPAEYLMDQCENFAGFCTPTFLPSTTGKSAFLFMLLMGTSEIAFDSYELEQQPFIFSEETKLYVPRNTTSQPATAVDGRESLGGKQMCGTRLIPVPAGESGGELLLSADQMTSSVTTAQVVISPSTCDNAFHVRPEEAAKGRRSGSTANPARLTEQERVELMHHYLAGSTDVDTSALRIEFLEYLMSNSDGKQLLATVFSSLGNTRKVSRRKRVSAKTRLSRRLSISLRFAKSCKKKLLVRKINE